MTSKLTCYRCETTVRDDPGVSVLQPATEIYYLHFFITVPWVVDSTLEPKKSILTYLLTSILVIYSRLSNC